MLKNLYLVCGVVALALGCSGTSTEPNTFTGGGVLWNPEAGDLAVNTAVYATTWPKGAVENGHWFWEVQTDVEDGGLSMIEWPVAPGDGADPFHRKTLFHHCDHSFNKYGRLSGTCTGFNKIILIYVCNTRIIF